MAGQLKNFIIKIQNSDEHVRKRWLFALTGVTMIIVISLWTTYINFSTDAAGVAASAESQELPITSPSPFRAFTAGLSIITDQLARTSSKTIDYFKKRILQPKEFTIENPEINFVPENLEPIPLTPLP